MAAIRDGSDEQKDAPLGSYDYVQPTEAIANLLCPICHSPFTEPWMSVACQHFYCRSCILQHLSNSEGPVQPTCPCDRSPISLESGQLVAAPRLVKLLCDELEVHCTTCGHWSGQRQHFAKHSREACGKQSPSCKFGCDLAALADEAAVAVHEKGHCPRRIVQCDMCSEKVEVAMLTAHNEDCSSRVASCPHCDRAGLGRTALAEHISEDCLQATIPCEHARFGCTWSGKRQDLRRVHLDKSCAYEPVKIPLLVSEARYKYLDDENSQLRREVHDLRGSLDAMSMRLNSLCTRLGEGTQADNVAPTPLSEQLASLNSQMARLTASTSQANCAKEQALHDLRGDFNHLQMGMHDVRGELMALQQAQYYEAASRLWTRKPPTSDIGLGAETGSSESLKEQRSPLGLSLSGMPPPFYAIPPVPLGLASQQPFYGPPPVFTQSGRRFFGWPFAPSGGTSPEGAPKL